MIQTKERVLDDLIAKLDNADAPDARYIIERARKLMNQGAKSIRKCLRRQYEPILRIYEGEYHLI